MNKNNINYDTLDEFFDHIDSGDKLLVHYGYDKRKSFSMVVLSVDDTSITCDTSTGFKIEIFNNSYNESTEKLIFKKVNNGQLNSISNLRQIFKIEDQETISFNPSITRKKQEKEETEYNNSIKPYKDYMDIDEDDESPYTTSQISYLEGILDKIKDKIKKGTVELNHSADNSDNPRLTSKFYIYIYQAPIRDYKNELIEFWSDWLDENGDDKDSIDSGVKKSPKETPVFDTEETNRITLKVSIDKNKTVYINKGINMTNRIKDLPAKAKSGHFFTENNFYFDEDDLNRGVFLGGKNGLIIHSIFDVKISYTEDDPDMEYSNTMSDSEIIDYLKDNKETMDFINKNPSFLEYLLSNGSKRQNRQITKKHMDFFKGKVDNLDTTTPTSHNSLYVKDSEISELTGLTLSGNPNKSGSKIVIPVSNDSGDYIGKIFLKEKDNIYDFNAKKYNVSTFVATIALKDGRQGKVKINV